MIFMFLHENVVCADVSRKEPHQ